MNRDAHEILQVQRNIQHFDVKQCKLLANWLAAHIDALEIDKKMFQENIQQLHLSARAGNVLKANGILTIGQLLTKCVNWDEIKILKGAGEKVVQEIQEKVAGIRASKMK